MSTDELPGLSAEELSDNRLSLCVWNELIGEAMGGTVGGAATLRSADGPGAAGAQRAGSARDSLYLSNLQPGSLDNILGLGRDLILFSGAPEDELTRARRVLMESAGCVITDETALNDFKRQIANFERAAGDRGLSTSEQARFFEQLTRMLSESRDAPVSLEDRVKIARQVLTMATTPTDVQQGDYKTCNVASIEVRTYWLQPSRVAQVVADAALAGRVNIGGRRAVLRREDIVTELSPTRLHASQIFQTAAVNLHWQNQTEGPVRAAQARIAVGLPQIGHIRYELHRSQGENDSGERLVDYSRRPPEVIVGTNRRPIRSPRIHDADIAALTEVIMGQQGQRFFLRNRDQAAGDSHRAIIDVASEQELHQLLADAQERRNGLRLPMTLRVNTNRPPFNAAAAIAPGPVENSPVRRAGPAGNAGAGPGEIQDPGQDDDPDETGWHVVTIMGYDSRRRLVAVDNTWNPSMDHLSEGRRIPLRTLFAATGN